MNNTINFNELPSNNPGGGIVPKGTYIATIEVAEMKQGKDASKPPYLNLRFALTNKDGKGFGKLYDILTNSDHEVVRYKLRRFIEALEIPFEGEFTLADLTKIIKDKKLIVDITHDTRSEPHKAVVDVFTNEIFYPMSEAGNKFGDSDTTSLSDNGSINASDSEDDTNIIDY